MAAAENNAARQPLPPAADANIGITVKAGGTFIGIRRGVCVSFEVHSFRGTVRVEEGDETKRAERARRIASLPKVYHQALTAHDTIILSTPISEVVKNVQSNIWDPVDILHAYGKRALKAQAATNCLTEIMFTDAEQWARIVDKTTPLAGVPISLKDTLHVKGYDSCYGYSSYANHPSSVDSTLVKLLKDAGAIPFVKTTTPITLLSFESWSPLWGPTRNPHVPSYTPGGSTGGEAALLAFGGSRIGIGTDVAGSVRVPAHFSGVYTIKASTGRIPRTGSGTSVPGQEGVPAVYSPMARTLEDLETVWRAIVYMKPWEYDHSCHPIPWREITFSDKPKLKWGVMWSDGIVPPSPACERALRMVIDVLRKDGHEIVDFHPPSPYEALQIGSQLLFADGAETVMRPFQFLEPNDTGVNLLLRLINLPTLFLKIYAWYWSYIRNDPLFAGLILTLGHAKRTTTVEQFALVARRELYRAQFFKAWKEEEGMDFLMTVPHCLPGIPHNGSDNSIGAVMYSFLFNIVDYTAGVLPVTKVSSSLDGLTPTFQSNLRRMSIIARSAFKNYDPEAMDGLPVGVQIVGRRLEEEKVLEGMKMVQSLLRENGLGYTLLNE